MAALVHLDAIEGKAPAGELPGEVHGVSGQGALG